MRTVRESIMNCRRGTTARKHDHTHTSNRRTTRLLRNKIQTCLKIDKVLHKQPNHTTHDQRVWPCMGLLKAILKIVTEINQKN